MTTALEIGKDTPFIIGGRTFRSRLMVGTGKYPDNETMAQAIEASGADVVTVAVRRVNLDRSEGSRGSSITSTPRASFCSPTPPAATRRRTRYATRAWRGKRGSTSS